VTAYRLPIFPLRLVLFPGAPQALHIFEPRYRQLLADCLEGDRRFGVSCVSAEGDEDPAPAPGEVGCRALIKFSAPLPDGRANVLAVGEERYAIRAWETTDRLYRVAVVEPYADLPEPESPTLARMVTDVTQRFERHARLLAALQDSEPSLPELPSDPAALSFLIASALNVEPRLKQELLAMRTARARLARLIVLLTATEGELTARVAIHQGAKRNGTGPRGALGSITTEA
jgi:Lon protease-like protein